MSTRETILSAIATTLVAAGIAGGRIWRTRREQIAADQLPAVVVEPESEEASEEALGFADALLTVAIQVFASGETPDSAADATVAAVHAAMLADLSLGLGDAVQVQPSRRIEWDFESHDETRVTLRYAVFYRTALGAM